jgi:two-component system LytT family response regulator
MKETSYTFIAVDDEPLALSIIQKYAELLKEWKLLGVFSSAVQARQFLSENVVDLVITDINMPEENGLELVRNFKDERPLIIFLTAYKEYAHEGFDLDVIDYLVKPVPPDRFLKAMEKAKDWLAFKNQAVIETPPALEVITVFSDYKEIIIPVQEILYIEAMGDYVKIFRESKSKPTLTLKRLKELEVQLTPTGFSRIHRSYLVNKNKIESRLKTKVKIGEQWLPVGETYR